MSDFRFANPEWVHLLWLVLAMVALLVEAGLLTAYTDYEVLGEADSALITVPTPLRKTRDPDISYIVSSVDHIAPELRPGQLIVLGGADARVGALVNTSPVQKSGGSLFDFLRRKGGK